MTHSIFNIFKTTLLGGREGHKKSTLCTLFMMLTIMDDPYSFKCWGVNCIGLMFGCIRRLGNGLLGQMKKRKLYNYGHWKRRIEGLVMAVTDGVIKPKRDCFYLVDGEQRG